jgi:hypothetical protein
VANNLSNFALVLRKLGNLEYIKKLDDFVYEKKVSWNGKPYGMVCKNKVSGNA